MSRYIGSSFSLLSQTLTPLHMHERVHPFPGYTVQRLIPALPMPCRNASLSVPTLNFRDLVQPLTLSMQDESHYIRLHHTKMDIEDDDAFLYGESSPPPTAAPEAFVTPKVETVVKPEVTPTRSSIPLV